MGDLMPPSDPLEELLVPHPAAPPSAEVFARTVRVLRRQRRLRRLGGVGILAATYAAGLLTVLACHPPAPVRVSVVEVQPSVEPPPEGKVELPSTPPEADWKEVSAEGVTLLYLQAGDLHLAEADPAEAMRCYGNALDNAKVSDLEVKSEDSWLLMAIKHARMKERKP
jgi:hypothetical protein